MADFLYYLCIFPLESFMGAVLRQAHAWSGSWGGSLVLLSLAVNVLLLPLYHVAECWQEAERAVQARMAAKLAEIKSVFTGRERYMMLRTLYRQHGYHPIMAVRTSVGFLIQVPFFFAAFHLLNNFTDLQGVAFMGMADLSRPDGLLGLGGLRVNVLPFVMTAANLVSAAVYAKRLSLREKRQLGIIAALFLVLLYTSSAALLVYWTCNNLVSLLKNLVYVRWVYLDAPNHGVQSPVERLAARLSGLWDRVPPLARPTAAVAAIALLVAGELGRRRLGLSSGVPALLMTLALPCAGLAAYCGLRALRRHADDAVRGAWGLALSLGVLALFLTWSLSKIKSLDTLPEWAFYRFTAVNAGLLVSWLMTERPLCGLWARCAAFCSQALPERKAGAVYAAAFVTLAVLIFLYTPVLMYLSDPEFFFESTAALVAGLTLRGLLLLALAWWLFRLTPASGRSLCAVAAAWAALLCCAYMLLIPADYGPMDEFLLEDTRLLRAQGLSALVDVLAMGGTALLLFLLARKKALSGLAGAFGVLALALVVVVGWKFHTQAPVETVESVKSVENEDTGEAAAKAPPYSEALLTFSREGSNVLVVMLDMFTGGHLGPMLREDPALAARFQGFTWYPDTMAPGAVTFLSIAALMGGNEYTPTAINARKPDDLAEEMHKAFALLPRAFSQKGYDVALVEVDELKTSLFEKVLPEAKDVTVAGRSVRTAYTGLWRQRKGFAPVSRPTLVPFMAAMGFFRGAPWSLRDAVYRDGQWMGSLRIKVNRSEGPHAMLDLLPELSATGNAPGSFKYMSSQLTHYPWQLDPDSCLPVDGNAKTKRDGIILEHYYNERCAMRALGRWFDWMREAGVYDNTQIILVSDHSGGDSAEIGADFDHLRNGPVPWKPHALLLVKNARAKGPLATDPRPMSSADVPALICRENGPCPGLSDPDPLTLDPAKRVRTHSSGLAGFHRHRGDGFNVQDYSVNGTMFAPENWRKEGGHGKK